MSLVISKEFKPTPRVLYMATRAIFHRKIIAWFFYGFFVGVPMLLVLLKLLLASIGFGDILILVGCLIYSFGLMPALHYLGARKSLLSNPSANQVQSYEISEQGIRNFSEGVEVNLSWDKIIDIKKTKKFVLFYFSKSCAYYIPNDLLSNEEIEQFYNWNQSA